MDNPGELPPVVTMVDIGVIALLLISALLAYARGLVHEVLSVAGWIGAIFATVYGFPYLKPYARELTTINILADLGAGMVIFVVSLVLLSLFTRAISRRVKDSSLNAIDRSLGFLFGLLRGALVVVVAYIGLEMVMTKDEQPEWVLHARSMELVDPGAALLKSLIPENFGAAVAAKPAGEDAGAEGAARKAKEIFGARRVVKDLLAPQPKGAGGKDAPGYGKKERLQMERLHDSIRDRGQ